MRPLWAFRNLVRLGCNMSVYLSLGGRRFALAARAGAFLGLARAFVLRHRVVLEDLALEHPDLHSVSAIGGNRGRSPVVHVRPQRMKRHATLAIPFGSRDLRPAEPSRTGD